MIDIDYYTTQINLKDLNYLVMGKEDLNATEITERDTLIGKKETHAQSIVKNRYGKLPSDTDFLNTVTVAGVLFLLTRQDDYADEDKISRRKTTFFEMLPSSPGRISKAAYQSTPTKLGDWP